MTLVGLSQMLVSAQAFWVNAANKKMKINFIKMLPLSYVFIAKLS